MYFLGISSDVMGKKGFNINVTNISNWCFEL